MPDALQLDKLDNVAVALRDLSEGEVCACVSPDGTKFYFTAAGRVPRYHKAALEDIPEGGEIIKYGEYIGLAAMEIPAGSYVHIHNVISRRKG